jgi:hypothetical protein
MRTRFLLLARAAVGLALALPLAGAESPRLSVIHAMLLRPNDPWPRGKGHVVFGVPGSPDSLKGYLEPGGSFSPAFASFGLSLWITDEKERLITTSDALPMDRLSQRFVWPDKPTWPARSDLPAIETTTPYYAATWTVTSPGSYQLHVRPRATNSIWLVLRSVGPAGAPLKSLHWFGDRLYVNDRWMLKLSAQPAAVEVVPPKSSDPLQAKAPPPKWPAEKDWGYARFKLDRNQEYWITLEDAVLPPASPLARAATRPTLKLRLPDTNFVECLNAQVTHLMMSLVGNETRPGEPNNYPLNWLRDGAYVIVALAHAGQIDVAKQLCRPFAENDFFGGFGSEADGPGLALWALGEVSAMADDPKFDRWLWPHVQRKVGLIEEMLAAKEPLRKPYVGPIVPAHTNKTDLDLVCGPAKDGLIQGRMDWHRPVIYVNAVSAAGLAGAGSLAARLQKEADAAGYFSLATKLREAVQPAWSGPEAENDRSFICGLYPTWIVTDRESYQSRLAARRTRSHDDQDLLKGPPLWTYFTLAEAHQWLALGSPAKVWNDLRWFWDHQASPGLYTWWEGHGEENTFRRWEQARGWTTPAHVTPHYWTAAEMLLLQLDMLAYVEPGNGKPVLVVGAGVPSAWLGKPLSVGDLPTSQGKVDWSWDKGTLTVKLRGFTGEVKPGAAFPADTRIKFRR